MHLHSKVFLATVVVTLAIIGIGSVFGETNDSPPASGDPSPNKRWIPGERYETGEGVWARSDLTLGEQDLLDRPDPTNLGDATKLYQAAAAYQASTAVAKMASARLGLSGIEETGVVP